jgi:hypothetical protein
MTEPELTVATVWSPPRRRLANPMPPMAVMMAVQEAITCPTMHSRQWPSSDADDADASRWVPEAVWTWVSLTAPGRSA